MKLAFFLFAAALQAQTLISIDAGSAAENACTGSKYGAAQQLDMANQPAPFDTVRYGPKGAPFSCMVPAPVGTCQVTLQFIENRPAVATATMPAAGPGLRVFTVSVNGVSTGPLDLFILAGAQKTYALSPITTTVTDGLLRFDFAATKGNASLAGWMANCVAGTPTASPKFITDIIQISAGQSAAELSKMPVPDSGMFVFFESTARVGGSRAFPIVPAASKQIAFPPPGYDGTLRVAYWSLDPQN